MRQAIHATMVGFALVFFLAACAGDSLGAGSPDGGAGACGPSSCEGCCTEEGACITSIWDRQCGAGGAPCADCTDRQEGCNEAGECQALPDCDPSNCPGGCCDGDECIEPGDGENACGARGTPCQVCDEERGHLCDGTQCRAPCGPDTCAGCCIDEFTCRDDPNERACGAGGQPCEDCGEDGSCTDDGQCVDSSCANTCNGCCTEEGECIDDADRDQCGFGGEPCAVCGSEDVCADPGVCIDGECSAFCNPGCCDGVIDGEPQCGGDSVEACGRDGEACVTCGPHSICLEGECRLDPSSRWDIIIENAEVPPEDENGSGWDRFSDPDPYVIVTVGLGTSDERTDQTPSVSNTTFADYDSFVVHEEVRAEAIASEGQLLFIWMDDDVFSDDQMSQERPVEVPEEFFNGNLIQYTQRDFYEDAENSPLEFIVRFRLVPSSGADVAYDPASHSVAGASMCSEGRPQILTADTP